jgi:hypothetical protein
MARVFVLCDGCIRTLRCDVAAPLHLDARGVPVSDGSWIAALVTFAPNACAAERHALVVRPHAVVAVGRHRVDAGVVEIIDGRHVFLPAAELILVGDDVPQPIADELAPCAVCLGAIGVEGRGALLRCPRCGARACDVCWSSAPGGRCLTPGCEQPAARDRRLAEPRPSDFCAWEEGA